jgi:D-methionine transport system substrate-binding protein
VTAVPHGEILEHVMDDIKAQGVNVEIVEYFHYDKPMLDLVEGEIDMNFMNHLPGAVEFGTLNRVELAGLGPVHIEAMGLYSKKHSSLENLPRELTVVVPAARVDEARALKLLHMAGLITFEEGAKRYLRQDDIEHLREGLTLLNVDEVELVDMLDTSDFVVINGNIALEQGLTLEKDALLFENDDPRYANIILTVPQFEFHPAVKVIANAIRSEKTRAFIKQKYGNAVVPYLERGEELTEEDMGAEQ